MTVLRLTDKVVRSLPPPAKRHEIAWDTEVKGFGVRTTAAGAKSLVLGYRDLAGNKRLLTIGSFPDWSVTQGRDQAMALKRVIDSGGDPLAERQAARAAPLMGDLVEPFMADYAARNRASSAAEAASILRQLIVPHFGKIRVADVDEVQVEAFHREISRTRPVRANRARSVLSGMFASAIKLGMRQDNPCRGVRKNRELARERYLTPEELERLLAALRDHPNQNSANAVRLLLLTGSRRNEVLGATWSEFDLRQGVWVKPAASTKSGRIHRTPLSAPARLLLEQMRAMSKTEALFPGRRQNEHQGDLKKFWRSLCTAARIEGVRVHDLRHSFASYLAGAGLSLPVIGALLGHRQPATTARYAHLLDDPLRAAVERVGAIVRDAEGVADGAGDVVPLVARL